MVDDKEQSLKGHTGTQAAEGMMGAPNASKVNAKSKAPPVQDRWFDTQLSRMYADLASEPVPKEMLDLLAKLKSPKD